MSNSYKVDISSNGREGSFSFRATSLPEAYEIAARRIIDTYNLSDKDCILLEDSDIKSWEGVCDTIYQNTGLDISDVYEVEETQNWM